MEKNCCGLQYYFEDERIEIMVYHDDFNLASIRYINSTREFIVDCHFIKTYPTKEQYISIKLL